MRISPGELYEYVDRWKECHRWIIVSDPNAHEDLVVVSVTTDTVAKDRTCRLGPSDHARITHASVVHFAGAMLIARSAHSRKVESGDFVLRGPVSDSALARIRAGFGKSDQAAAYFVKKVEEQGLI
ncbi:MAG: hypothetical protein K8T20_12505 [Planctomycetes bacterium]|nr:hypothetical protein [Planctomycetota bacterium]